MPETELQQCVSLMPDDDLAASVARLKQIIAKVGELLPAQGPINAFAFLNTLQGLEHLKFDEGVKRGARLFGCLPYMPEDAYRETFRRGRIRRGDGHCCGHYQTRRLVSRRGERTGTEFSQTLRGSHTPLPPHPSQPFQRRIQ